jgi:hypothetical protein
MAREEIPSASGVLRGISLGSGSGERVHADKARITRKITRGSVSLNTFLMEMGGFIFKS